MKNNRLIKLLILAISIFLLTGCSNKEKDNTKTFELNFKTDVFSAYFNEDLLNKRIHEENTLIFEPKKDGEASFISIKAKKISSNEEECMNYLESYMNSLKEQGNKITIISQETKGGISFLNYSILSKNGNITTIYSKCSSNDKYTIKCIYYCCYSNSEEPNLTLKESFDSIILNK